MPCFVVDSKSGQVPAEQPNPAGPTDGAGAPTSTPPRRTMTSSGPELSCWRSTWWSAADLTVTRHGCPGAPPVLISVVCPHDTAMEGPPLQGTTSTACPSTFLTSRDGLPLSQSHRKMATTAATMAASPMATAVHPFVIRPHLHATRPGLPSDEADFKGD